MTDGTLASSRTTGSSTSFKGCGANSTMNTATNSEQTNETTTAPAVVTIVLQISGQARSMNCGAFSRSPDVKIDWICVSTLPPGKNQLNPLWANDGHASLRTNRSIATRTPTTTQTSAPSPSSARRSWSSPDCGSRSSSSLTNFAGRP